MKNTLIGFILIEASALAIASSSVIVSANQNDPNTDTSDWTASQITEK
ncbi:hypothetical protein [Lacticaseibacillus paracasei]|nr:hypothetical protein [Lacticaseibacillus paracasei]